MAWALIVESRHLEVNSLFYLGTQGTTFNVYAYIG